MPTSRVRTAVLQTTVIYLASEILSLYLNTNMLDKFQEDKAVQDLLAILSDNSTHPDPPSMGFYYKSDEELTIYSWHLPREALVGVLISTLQYYWMIWLEKILPARPRRRDLIKTSDGEGESDIHEENIVKRWIAQGRVKRASLNWCNTFLKWMLELTVGRLWYHSIEHVFRTLLELKHPKNVMLEMGNVSCSLELLSPFCESDWLTRIQHLASNFFGAYVFSMAPLATLLAFAVVPVHQQIVFIAGADLLGTVFMTMLIRVFAGWAVKTEIVQGLIRDMTEDAQDKDVQGILRELRLRPDEL